MTLKQTECRKRNKKIAAAVYLYQADNDGEWGEIRFNFENGTAEIDVYKRQLSYELYSKERTDASEISWYRCDTETGTGAVLCLSLIHI